MAPRRGADLVEEPQPGGLQFNEPLSWRAGKPIATGELLRRLDALSNELREMDQDATDKDSLTLVAKELAGSNLLNHKDKGVRAFTACCLVDVLKICAPDAPFTPTQLKAIFTLFIATILPALSDPSNAYNTQHKYVLASLADVKSIVLLVDIPGYEALFLHIFASFFDTISGASKASSGESIAKDVEFNMSQILVTLVDESPSLPPEVVDVIVAQFMRAWNPKGKHGEVDETQSTLHPREFPPAYQMAKTICNSCPEKMARYISQYFNDVILDASGGASGGAQKSNGHRRTSDAAGESDDEGASVGPTEADLRELSKAHELLKELWRASPAVLQNVIPQLEAELSAESVQLRLLATETLGDIISGIGSAGPPPPPSMDPAAYPQAKLEDYQQTSNTESMLITPMSPQSFSQTHSNVYQSFLGRKNDKSLVIRSAWSIAAGRILVTSAGGIGMTADEESNLVKGLGEKLNDVDEKVRIAAVKAVRLFGFYDIMTKLAPYGSVSKSGSVLCSLADRARDRKHAVRVEGMTTLGRIWGVASGEIAAGNDSVADALGAIPTRIFDSFYANDRELNVLLDHVMFEQLIPLNYPPKKGKGSKAANGESQSQAIADVPFDADKIRTERILLVVKSLDARSKKAFFAMQARQTTFSNVLESFLKRCEEFNGGVTDKDSKEVKSKLDAIIKWLGDLLPDPLRTNLDLHKYAKLHDRRSYQLLRFAMAPESDYNTVWNAIKEFRKRIENAPGAPAGILETLNPIIFRSSCLIYNRSHQPVIMQYSRTDENGLGATANEVMKEISDKLPQIFQASVTELCKSLEEQAPSKTKSNDPSSVETLKALASFVKSVDHKIPNDRKFVQALVNFALYGSPPKAAKYAVSILVAATDRKEMHMKDLLDKSTQGWEYGGDQFLTKLATISQLTLLDPKTVDDANDEILDITTHQVLLQTRTPVSDENKFNWQSDADVDEECQAKCWAIKTLVNRLRTTTDVETAKKLAVPVFKLLNTLIVKKGELSNDKETPQYHKSRLRLLAAQQMLKICTSKIFDDLVSPVEFNRLAFVVQDAVPQVRRGFIEKLQKYLVKGRLSNRFLTIIFLTAFEPKLELKKSIMTWIRSRVKIYRETKNKIMESVFPRLLHLLAHHPDYSTNPEELLDTAKYILYYTQTVISEDNLALVYKYAERVKGARDAIPGADPDALYILSDLAQALLKKWEEKKGWSMQTWPAKVGMPVGLFRAMESHEVAQEVAEKNYLPEGIEDELDELIKASERKKVSKSKSKRKAAAGDDENGSPRPSKKVKSELKPKKERKERVAKEKKTPKPKKNKELGEESANRRKSSRAAMSAKGVKYADRDDSEDDEEMWDGVASWEYLDENGNPKEVDVSEEEGEGQDEDDEDAMSGVEMEAKKEKVVRKVKEMLSPSPSPTPEEEEEEPEDTPAPQPKSKGRKLVSSRAVTKKVQKIPEPESEAEQDESELSDAEEPEPTPPPKLKSKGRKPTGSQASAKKTKKITEPEPEVEAEEEELELSEEPEPEPTPPPAKSNGRKRGRPRADAAKSSSAASKSKPKLAKTPAKGKGKGKQHKSEEKVVEDDEEEEGEKVVEEPESSPPSAKAKSKGRKTGTARKGKAVPEPEPEPEDQDKADEADEESELSEVEVEEEVEPTPPPPKTKGRKPGGTKDNVAPEPEPGSDLEVEPLLPPPKTTGRKAGGKKGKVIPEPEQESEPEVEIEADAEESELSEPEEPEEKPTPPPKSNGKKPTGAAIRKAIGARKGKVVASEPEPEEEGEKQAEASAESELSELVKEDDEEPETSTPAVRRGRGRPKGTGSAAKKGKEKSKSPVLKGKVVKAKAKGKKPIVLPKGKGKDIFDLPEDE